MSYRVRNFSIIFLILLVAVVIQFSLFVKIPYMKFSPNLLLIITAFLGYAGGKNTGMLTGFFAGLIIDVFYCPVIGYNALVFLTIGLICGLLNRMFYADNLFAPILILMLCDLGNELLYFFVWHVLQAKFDFGYTLIHIILPEMSLTFIAGLLLFKPLTFLAGKMYSHLETDDQEL